MSNYSIVYLFYGAASLVVIILIIMFFRALQSITRIESTMRELLKLIEQHERRKEEKDLKRLP